MLIASAAMFFAVAGSAFIVRARLAGHCCARDHRAAYHAPASEAPTIGVAPPRASSSSTPCGEAVYQPNDDGTVSVVFHECQLGDFAMTHSLKHGTAPTGR